MTYSRQHEVVIVFHEHFIFSQNETYSIFLLILYYYYILVDSLFFYHLLFLFPDFNICTFLFSLLNHAISLNTTLSIILQHSVTIIQLNTYYGAFDFSLNLESKKASRFQTEIGGTRGD